NIILGLGMCVIGVLMIMGQVTLKHKLNSLEGKMDRQKQYWKSIENSIDIQSNQIVKEIEERGQFEEIALGQLAENINELGANVKEKIDVVTRGIEQSIKDESAKNLFMHIRKIE
ncbi:MAG: hypothetical protein RR744_07530, partial [Cellulosilyticaceae bacterium]